MEYTVPIVMVLAIVIGVLIVTRLVNRKRRDQNGTRLNPQNHGDRDVPAPAITRNATTQGVAGVAEEVNAKLNSQQHKAIYALIAQGHQIAAIREYQLITGCKLREAYVAIGALEAFPQQEKKPVSEIVNLATNYRYRAIVSKGDEVREISSTRLNDEVFGRVRQLALAEDFDHAANLLCEHADVTFTDAREFVTFIRD